MKKFAVILSGCGVFDGSEIHETTLTLLAIVKHNCEYEIFAPDIEQHHVINHITGEVMNEKRNVLIESARIARGKIKNISKLNVDDFDAIIFPGGFGVSKNLSTYAFDGHKMKVIPEVENLIKKMVEIKKPIAAMCISPVLLAKVIKDVALTIGQDDDTIVDLQ
ncbi:MAG TPA: isoprenoid biosynthesis protein ElbB, partial [Clostridiales bacterium]|nr:isoprenoid biosynthesis protein ElbB [Clostridiales bacterium]